MQLRAVFIGLMVVFTTLAQASQQPPDEIVATAASEILDILSERREELRNDPEALYSAVDSVLLPRFDVIYAGRVVLDWQDDPLRAIPPTSDPLFAMALASFVLPRSRMVQNQLEQVQHSATLRAELKLLQETLRIELLAMGNFSTEELMLRPKIGYDIADALKIIAGAELYFGPDETLFGTISTLYGAGFVELRASF